MFLELRFAIRQLIRQRGLTATAALTLALGLGATTAIFSVLFPVLIEPLPYPEPQRLVRVFESIPDGGRNSVSGGAYLDWRAHSSSFDRLAIYEPVRRNLSGAQDRPELVKGLRVSVDFLRTFGVEPQLGRDFAPGEDQVGGENRVILLGYGLWKRAFGGREDVVGGVVRLNQVSHRIIGVLPPAALLDIDAEYLMPVIFHDDEAAWTRSGHWRSVVGRLAPGRSVEGTQAELQGIKQRLGEHYPSFKDEWGVAVVPLQEAVAGETRPTLILLFGTVVMVLAIACANVSSLLLARGRGRWQEMAVRGALGADRWRIARQMLTESLLLASLGSVGGLMVAGFGVDILAATVAAELPAAVRPELDHRVLFFGLALTFATGLVFGLLPAWRAGRASVQQDLKDQSRGSTSAGQQRSLRALVAAELAFTVVVVVGAGLFLRSFLSVLETDPGFIAEETLAFDVIFPNPSYPEMADRMAFIDTLREKLETLPGVEAVGAGASLPLSRAGRTEFLSRHDRPLRTDYTVGANFISGDYLTATGMQLFSGRGFRPSDFGPEAERVILVDRRVAEELYPGEEAIGHQVRFLGEEPWRIVGVVSSVRHWVLDEPPRPFAYLPQSIDPFASSFVMRSELEPLELARMAREEVRSLDEELAVAYVRTLQQDVERSLFHRRITLTLLGLFAGLALILAAVGIYGMMSYVVSQRDRELAIRSVFGARALDVATLIIKDGLKPTLTGLLLGLGIALGAARLIESQLYEVRGGDPLVLAASVALLASMAVMAIFIPAYRAAVANPARAVRSE